MVKYLNKECRPVMSQFDLRYCRTAIGLLIFLHMWIKVQSAAAAAGMIADDGVATGKWANKMNHLLMSSPCPRRGQECKRTNRYCVLILCVPTYTYAKVA